MIWSWYVIIAGLLLAAAASFFFALAESALFALGKWRTKQLAEEKPAEGRRLLRILEQGQDLLATVGLGNTIATGLAIGLTVWALAHSTLAELPSALGVFCFFLIVCEVAPKALGVRAPDFWALRVARPLVFLLEASRPLRKIAQGMNEALLRLILPKVKPQPAISENEYQDLLGIAQQQGALGNSERELILHILDLDNRTVREVMKPRSMISCISDELTREEMLEEARKLKHTRLPIYDETPDTIVGVLNVRAFLLNPGADLEEVIEFPSFVPESMNLLHLLRSLQRQRRGMAIVLDEFGGTAGLVTLEDILEDVLGSFQKRGDKAFTYQKLGPGKWRVSGLCPIEEFRREYPGIGEVDEVDTMAGLFVRQMEYVPGLNETTAYKGLKLTAVKVDDRRVHEMTVETFKK